MGGTAACQGSPYSSDFFALPGNYFEKRHRVLFNLYAFDGLNSVTIVTP
jgi:hypothetical protein